MVVGAGSLDLAYWTLCSSFCILPIRPRIWCREVELGKVVDSLPRVVLRPAGVIKLLLRVVEGSLDWRDTCEEYCKGFGVVEFVIDIRGCLGAGVCSLAVFDLSDVGGDGGVWVSEAIEDTDLFGGVATVGEVEAVLLGDLSEATDSGRFEIAIDGVWRFRNVPRASSACLSFSCLTSASTFRSESSSRNL